MADWSRGIDLSVKLADIQLDTPIILASGILGNSPSLLERVAGFGAGAVVTKTVTYRPRKGYENPTFVKINGSTYLNAMGLPNPGFKVVAEELRKANLGIPVIASIAPSDAEEAFEMSKVMGEVSDGIELNLSCPHVRKIGLEIGSDPRAVAEIVRSAKSSAGVPILSKISPNLTDVVAIGKAAATAGSKCLVACNTLKGMAIDIKAIAPVLSNTVGGLSGKYLHPVALRMVFELYVNLGRKTQIVGSGGVVDWKTAVEFILAGASAIQIGSVLVDSKLEAFRTMASGIASYLSGNGFGTASEIIGLATPRRPTRGTKIQRNNKGSSKR